MKKIAFIILLVILLIGCSENQLSYELRGEWSLIESSNEYHYIDERDNDYFLSRFDFEEKTVNNYLRTGIETTFELTSTEEGEGFFKRYTFSKKELIIESLDKSVKVVFDVDYKKDQLELSLNTDKSDVDSLAEVYREPFTFEVTQLGHQVILTVVISKETLTKTENNQVEFLKSEYTLEPIEE